MCRDASLVPNVSAIACVFAVGSATTVLPANRESPPANCPIACNWHEQRFDGVTSHAATSGMSLAFCQEQDAICSRTKGCVWLQQTVELQKRSPGCTVCQSHHVAVSAQKTPTSSTSHKVSPPQPQAWWLNCETSPAATARLLRRRWVYLEYGGAPIPIAPAIASCRNEKHKHYQCPKKPPGTNH